MKTIAFVGMGLLCLLMNMACSKETTLLDPKQLENSEWLVLQLNNDDLNFDAQGEYILTFLSDGGYRINMDLNSCSGAFSHSPNEQSIDFKQPACTQVCCDSNFAIGMLTFLYRDVDSYSLDGNQLVLSNDLRSLVLERH